MYSVISQSAANVIFTYLAVTSQGKNVKQKTILKKNLSTISLVLHKYVPN
jgi:hypothetical protein